MSENPTTATAGRTDPAQWVDRHADALYRYALLRLRDAEAAEDLVQETFLAALSARNGFSGKSSERTWLVGILKHKISDHLRRRSRETASSAVNNSDDPAAELFDRHGHWKVTPSAWNAGAMDSLERGEFWDVFHKCFSALPRRLADAFALRELDEQSTAEICNILNVSPTNLGVMLHRARLRLARCLDVHWFGKPEGGKP